MKMGMEVGKEMAVMLIGPPTKQMLVQKAAMVMPAQ
jgi:hypothetical protein